jgi:hypothetical protein
MGMGRGHGFMHPEESRTSTPASRALLLMWACRAGLCTATAMAIVTDIMGGKRLIKAAALKIFCIYTYRSCHYTDHTVR